jgi:hypothetical protein
VAGNNTQKNKFMKLKKIDFNAKLIGQDGIVVKTTDDREPKQLTYFKCKNDPFPIRGVINESMQTWYTRGTLYAQKLPSPLDLIMYKEVKVLTVDEWYEQYSDVSPRYRGMFHDFAAAIKAGEVEV